VLAAGLLAVGAASTSAFASGFGDNSSSLGYTPKVPVSSLAQAASWFDPSRFHVSTSVTMGSGFSGGGAAEGLQVTSLNYQFKRPVWMSVNVGNSWGPSSHGNNSMFLEGLDFGMRPFGNFQFEVHYRDFRSPLQYQNYYSGYGYPSFGRPYGWGQ